LFWNKRKKKKFGKKSVGNLFGALRFWNPPLLRHDYWFDILVYFVSGPHPLPVISLLERVPTAFLFLFCCCNALVTVTM